MVAMVVVMVVSCVCFLALDVAHIFYQQQAVAEEIGVAETEVSFVHVLMAEVADLTFEQVVTVVATVVAIGD
jgi:hypothetical protein